MKYRSLLAVLFTPVFSLCALAGPQNSKTTGNGPAGPLPGTKADHQLKTAPVSPATFKGAFLAAELDGGLNAKKLKPGDKVKASLTQALVLHGKVVAPVDSKLVGHVTEARAKTESEHLSRLGIVFDKLLLKHHRQIGFQATLQRVDPPSTRPTAVDRPSQMLPPSLMGPQRMGSLSPMGGPGRVGATPATNVGSLSQADSMDGSVSVRGTPGSIGGDMNAPANLPRTMSERTRPISAAQGIAPGVYGIKNLSLGVDSETPGHVIVSGKSTVKLEDGTQVILRITGPAVPLADE